MPFVTANGIRICYETAGPEDGAPLLLVAGLGMQLTRWHPDFLALLAERGFRVVIPDNRDVGLSDGFESAGIPNPKKVLSARLFGFRPKAPYMLGDMADDMAGLLEALEIPRAHVVGVSMGGMIAQQMAVAHPGKVASLVSIMSTTGRLTLPPATKEAQRAIGGPRPDPKTDLDGYLDASVAALKVIGSPGYPGDEAEMRARALADYQRAFRPSGFARQYAAILAAPGRDRALKKVAVPAAVIHGVDDPLVRVEGGRATAAAIPGAELVEIPGMGHDLPRQLWPRIVEIIAQTAGRAGAAAAA